MNHFKSADKSYSILWDLLPPVLKNRNNLFYFVILFSCVVCCLSFPPVVWFTCCVSIQDLHPSEEHLKAVQSRSAAHKCSFFSLFLQDAPVLSFLASHIQRFFFACPVNKKEREKMATSCGVERLFHGLGGRNRDVRVKKIFWHNDKMLQRLV